MTDETILKNVLELPDSDKSKFELAVKRNPDVPRLLNNVAWEGTCLACLNELVHGKDCMVDGWRKTRTWAITRKAIIQTYKERYLLMTEW